MKLFVLTTWVLMSAVATGGERERGLRLYREGQFAEAQAAFEAALAEEPDSAELQWNLALAAWRAGNLGVAEVAAEKYAAHAENARPELHRGLLGAVRFAEATQLEQAADQLLQQSGPQKPRAAVPAEEPPEDPLPIYEQALQKAMQAKKHFVRGVRAKATPELVRNTERVLRKIDSLKKRIEELMSQRQPNQQESDPNGDKQDQKDKQDGDPSQDEQKPDGEKPEDDPSKEGEPEKGESENGGEPKPGESKQEQDPQGEGEQESGDPQTGEPQPGEEAPEPEPSKPTPQNPEGTPEGEPGEASPSETPESGEEPVPEPEAGEGAGQAGDKPGDPTTPRQDAPGEGVEGRKLSPEEAQRVMERLKDIDKKMKAARARARGRRRKVGRDW